MAGVTAFIALLEEISGRIQKTQRVLPWGLDCEPLFTELGKQWSGLGADITAGASFPPFVFVQFWGGGLSQSTVELSAIEATELTEAVTRRNKWAASPWEHFLLLRDPDNRHFPPLALGEWQQNHYATLPTSRDIALETVSAWITRLKRNAQKQREPDSNEFTEECRPPKEWSVILECSTATFHNRIKGIKGEKLKHIKEGKEGYRLHRDQVPLKSKASRDEKVKAANLPGRKNNRKKSIK